MRLPATFTRDVQVEAVPEMDETTPEWQAWCDARGFYPLGSGRRAWCPGAETYLRGAVYLVWDGEALVDVADADEVKLKPSSATVSVTQQPTEHQEE